GRGLPAGRLLGLGEDGGSADRAARRLEDGGAARPVNPRRLSFLHLSGPRRGAVDPLPLPALIGSEAGSPVRVPGVAPRHASVFERDGEVVLQDGGSGSGTLLEGELVQEAVLRDGDVLELGAGGPKLRLRDEDAPRVPLGKALAWARPEGAPDRLSDLPGFARVLLRETAARTTLAFRATLAGVLALGLLVFAWTQWQSHRVRVELTRLREALQAAESERQGFYARIEEERRRAEADRSVLEARLEELRGREEQLSRQLAEAAAGEVHAVRQDLAQTRDRLTSLEGERAAGERVIREYGPGVCLIQGAFAFYDKDARPLRYRLEEGSPVRDDEGNPVLDPAGTGAVHLVEYFGTGFLLDRTGRGAVAGQPVVVVGYPAGLEALLAKTDGKVVKEVLTAAGTSSERITEVLARKGLIRPSTTQGHIGDVTKSDIVFDAPTTQGGSGGPVLNKEGVVIGVGYAVL